MKMNPLIIPSILAATILIAGIFSFIPVEKATAVHGVVLANTLRQSEATFTATSADNDIVITCPSASNGCHILDLYVEENDLIAGVNNDIDLGQLSNTIDGDVIIITADLNLQVSEGRINISDARGVGLGSDDILTLVVVDGSSESASYNWRVIAQVEGFTDIVAGES